MDVKKYYLKINIGTEFHAGTKAKKDVEEILYQEGFVHIDLFGTNERSKIRKGKIFIKNLIKHLLSSEYTRNSLIFFQLIPYSTFRMASTILLKILFKGQPKILLVHDLESIRMGNKKMLHQEKSSLSLFTHAIFHSLEMQAYAEKVLGYSGRSYVIGFFDYLIQERNKFHYIKNDLCKKKGKYIVAFAGNLSPTKSQFLYNLKGLNISNYILHLYGINWEGTDSEWIKYKGAYSPEELPLHIEADFGLVWDGCSPYKLEGNSGNYLKYNSPHKASLYAVSNLPLIVPRESAIYKLVTEYNIGFGVDSLLEIDDILASLSEDQYITWKNNVIKLGEKLAEGRSLKYVLNLILSDIEKEMN